MRFKELMEKRMPTHGELEGLDIRCVYRRLSLPFTYILYHIGFTAHMVSFLMIAVSIWTAWLIITGKAILGIALWQLWLVLDSVDGEIARLRNSCSSRGWFLDLIFENICFPLNFIAIGYYTHEIILAYTLAFLWLLCIITRYNYLECLQSKDYNRWRLNASENGFIKLLRYISYGEFKTVVAAFAIIFSFFDLAYFLPLIAAYLSVRWIIMCFVLYATLAKVDKNEIH